MRTLFVFLFLFISFFALPAGAADLVQDERRIWSDGSPQEVWFYESSIAPENLVRKDLFWEDGTLRSRQAFVGGVQSGSARTWYPNGNKETEEEWKDGGLHGTVLHWPDPRDDRDRKKQLKPRLEAHWEGGKEHGSLREWDGWGDARWMRVERFYVHGELDGTETVRRSEERMTRKHTWRAGRLHGRQMGWDYNGKMEYQYNFEDGEPQGPQRKYEGDTIVQELYFVDGLLHGTVSWEDWLEHLGSEWRSGIRTDRDLDDEGRLELIRRYTFVPGPRFESGSGKIQFHGETRNLDTYAFSDDGALVRTRIEGEPDVSFEWYPSGGLRRFSGTRSGSPVGRVMEFHEDGRLFRDEAREGSVRRGPRLIYDRRGRLVQQQEWDHYMSSQVVTLWHTDEIKAAEGNIDHGQGNDAGAKRGEWTYWTSDGRLLRTESYGPGPYSGNRAFIKQMIQYDDQERVEFEGSEKALTLFTYDADDPELVRVNRSVKLLDRSRFGVDAWDPELFTIVRAEVKKPTELDPSAQVLEVLGGRAVVLSEERFRGDGSRKSVHRWNGSGSRHGLQEGWYRDGSKKYVYEYRRGAFRSGSEWGRDGSSREPQPERRFP